MGYRDPKLIVNQGNGIIQGMAAFQQSLATDLKAFTSAMLTRNKMAASKLAIEEKKQTAYQSRKETAEQDYTKLYLETREEAGDLVAGMGKNVSDYSDYDAAKGTSEHYDADKAEAKTMGEQITNNLLQIQELNNDKIKALGTEATSAQIKEVLQESIIEVGRIKQDIQNISAAYEEYKKARVIPQGQTGSLVLGENPEMIAIFQSWEDGKQDSILQRRPDGKGVMLGLYKDKDRKIFSDVVDATQWGTKAIASNGGSFFTTAQKPDLGELIKQIKKPGFMVGASALPLSTQEQAKREAKGIPWEDVDAWLKTPIGMETLDTYVPAFKEGKGSKLAYWGGMGISKDGVNTNTYANYSDENYRAALTNMLQREFTGGDATKLKEDMDFQDTKKAPKVELNIK